MIYNFNRSFLIGQELVKRKFITQDQLDEGLILQQRKRIKLGAALIELHYISDEDLAKVVAEQLGIVYRPFETLLADQTLLERVPKELVKSYVVFPVAFDGTWLTVCVVDPLDKTVGDVLMQYLGKHIKLEIATKDSLQKAINNHYTF